MLISFINSAQQLRLSEKITVVNVLDPAIEIHGHWLEDMCVLACQGYGPCPLKLHGGLFCRGLVFVLEGEAVVMSARPVQTLAAGQFMDCFFGGEQVEISRRHTKLMMIGLTQRLADKIDTHIVQKTNTMESQHLARNVMADLFETAWVSPFRRLYMAAKVLELLALLLEIPQAPTVTKHQLPDREVTCLQEVKNLIDQNLQVTWSLTELARKSGLNDFKLKRSFKMLFGETVFGYLARARMEKAHGMLVAGFTVNQVAEAVGYKNPHHFTVAFKKKYRQLPSQVFKKQRLGQNSELMEGVPHEF